MPSWIVSIITSVVTKMANKIVDEVIVIIRKRTQISSLDRVASDLKEELKVAESDAEREAVLDKVNDLINSFGSV